MIDLNTIVQTPEAVRDALQRRGEDVGTVDAVIELDARRRELIQEADDARNRRNTVSRAIGQARRKPTDDEVQEMRNVGNRIQQLAAEQRDVEAELRTLMLTIPNIPLDDVPVGFDESANIVVRASDAPQPTEWAQPHWTIGERLNIIDMESAANISGARFYLLKGKGARLHRAIVNWLIDTLVDDYGYEEIDPPYLVREETLIGAGNLPKFADDLFRDTEAGLWLIPTSEVSLNGMFQDSIIDQALPLRYCARTPCFRREHAAAGRDVRGMKRVKQFEKVEMFRFVHPEDSVREQDDMVNISVDLCERLGLTTRVLKLCTGDIAFQSARTFDIEVWSPGSAEWLEVSSVSTCTDFQARRTNTRYRPQPGKGTAFPHTLNGSALGMPRVFIAVLEAGLQPDGSVAVPEPLQRYTGFARIHRDVQDATG